ncbi:hypothetical protein ACWGJP_08170 [Microbacterium sp. NPDC055903]
MTIDRNVRTRLAAALPAAVLALSLAACGAPAAERPTSDELSEGIAAILEDGGQGGILTDEQITCVADELIASDVTDQDLANLAAGQDQQTSQEAYDLVKTEMAAAVATCSTAE